MNTEAVTTQSLNQKQNRFRLCTLFYATTSCVTIFIQMEKSSILESKCKKSAQSLHAETK